MDITTASFATHEGWYAIASAAIIVVTCFMLVATFCLLIMVLLEGRRKLGFFVALIASISVAIGGLFLFDHVINIPDQKVSEGRANIEGRAEFDHGITELFPVETPIETCIEGSDRDVAQYTWTTGGGKSVIGHVTKTAEADGKCVYTFTVEGNGD